MISKKKSLYLRYYLKKKNFLEFHNKKLALGKIYFISDDLYFYGIKIKSSFRPVMINQPSSDRNRSVIQGQINKFSMSNPKMYTFLLTIVFLVITTLSAKSYMRGLLEVHIWGHGYKSALFDLVFGNNLGEVDSCFGDIIVEILFNI